MREEKITTFLIYKTFKRSSPFITNREMNYGFNNILLGRIILHCSGSQFLDYFQWYDEKSGAFDISSEERVGHNINIENPKNFSRKEFNIHVYEKILEYLENCKKEFKEFFQEKSYIDDSEFNLWGKYVDWYGLISDKVKERRRFIYLPEINYNDLSLKEVEHLEKKSNGIIKESEFKKCLNYEWPSEIVDFFIRTSIVNALKKEYLDIKFKNIKWKKENKTTKEIIDANFCLAYNDYYNGKVKLGEELDLNDNQSDLLSVENFMSWKNNETWIEPPFFLCNSKKGNEKISLLEGYTRAGILKGLLNKGKISPDKIHEVYIGYYI
jgi:hypothetical protein